MASTYADPGLLKTIQQKNREVEKKQRTFGFIKTWKIRENVEKPKADRTDFYWPSLIVRRSISFLPSLELKKKMRN